MNDFQIEKYKKIIATKGLQKTWNILMNQLLDNGIEWFNKNYFNFDDIGKFYEIGLAETNKISKKQMGKYYTPKDVAVLMSQLLLQSNEIKTIADVGCGCGNLIIEFLKELKQFNINVFKKIIKSVYIYDLDKTAINICSTRIKVLFKEFNPIVNEINCNFLSSKIKLPNNCCVITNPPYSISKYTNNALPAYMQAKDLYVGFMEKIIKYCKSAVFITPQSFIVGSKFSKIRQLLSKDFYGEIYSFDNVPATIFEGKKEGVFNTNTSNGVRASITYINRDIATKGFRLSHLIRFKAIQRNKIININYLKKVLGNNIQDLKQPIKCFKKLENFVYQILKNKDLCIRDLISNSETKYKICVNSSARYFIVATNKQLQRNGYFNIFAKTKNDFYLLYALLNSSYCYMFWRMLDGGILLPKSILLKIPFQKININNKIISLVDEMIKKENQYKKYKLNAGVKQETVKFPNTYREKLNKVLFNNIDFNLIHSNMENEYE